MNVITVSCGPLMANCYIVESGSEAVIIDPGFCEKKIADYITQNPNKVRYIMLTHGHFDHVSAVGYVKEKSGAVVLISANDEKGLYDDEFNLSDSFVGLYPAADCTLRADLLIDDGDEFPFGNTKIKVLATPGHSKGSVCFLIDDCLFSGDTIFRCSIGRTDFPGSDLGDMMMSLDRLKTLDDGMTVYPGHGEKTTIGFEKQNNLYLKY